MDVNCLNCGEPWEIYSIRHEFSPEKREKFWAGEECPCCPRKGKGILRQALEEREKREREEFS